MLQQQQQQQRPALGTGPDVSNSLQRMLELERQFMLQRLQALSPNDTVKHSQPSPTRPNAPPRRPELAPHNGPRPSSRSPRRSSFSVPQVQAQAQAPLVNQRDPSSNPVSANTGIMTSQYANLAAMVDDLQPPVAVTQSDKPSPKVVAFQFPPDFEDRKSLCQSPSWEAYDRRKKERRDEKKEEKKRKEEERKKEEKRKEEKRKEEERKREEKRREEEKRKKEEDELKKAQQNAAKKASAPKPRRLSKPPPATAQTLDQIKAAAPGPCAVPRTQKPRPNSALGLVFPGSEDGAERPPRRRSGSFTSLIRAPFEHRRASFDLATGRGGFIGGIKLEQERFDAEQRANEADIHPALRKPKLDSRTSSPQRSPLPPSSRAESAQRRAYPPITILTASSKTRSLASPDVSRMDRLRARVGLKPAPRTASADGRLGAPPKLAESKHFSSSNVSLPAYESSTEKSSARQSKESLAPKSPGLAPESSTWKTDKASRGRRNINEKQLNIRIPQKDEIRTPEASAKSSPMMQKDHNRPSDGEPTLSELIAKEDPDSALALPPLRPPRKSSKRSLGTSSNASSPSTATPRLHSAASPHAGVDVHDFLGAFSAPYYPPSLELSPKGVSPSVAPRPQVSEDGSRPGDQEARPNSLGITLQSNPTEPSGRSSTDRQPNEGPRPSLGKLVTSESSAQKNKPRRHQPPTSGDSDGSLGNMILSQRPISSASETSSEEVPYHSSMSTPATSYPQSEKELTPVPTDTELDPSLGERRKPTKPKQEITAGNLPVPPVCTRQRSREIDEEIELDRIQAAARKVMAAFPPASPPRADRRTQSDPDVAASAGLLPRLKLQPLKRKDKSKLDQVTGPAEVATEKENKRPLLKGHMKAKSAVNLPRISRAQLAPPSPSLSPTSLPTPTFHPPRASTSSLDISSKAQLQLQPPLPHAPRTSTDSISRRIDSAGSVAGAPVAKMFVECCSCKYYHDMPSRLYEAMASPDAPLSPTEEATFGGSVARTVRCPWCRHDMSTRCCAGLAAMVYVKERLH